MRAVDERLLDDGAGDLVADINRDVVIADRQRHVAAIDQRHQRAERLVRRRPLEALEPERLFLDADELVFLDAIELLALHGQFLLVGSDQFNRSIVGRRDFDFASQHVDLVGLREFQRGVRTDDDLRRLEELERDGVRAAGICPDPVARLEDQSRRHGGPAFVQDRLDADDALRIGHRADTSIVDKRVRDHKLLVRTVRCRCGGEVQPARHDENRSPIRQPLPRRHSGRLKGASFASRERLESRRMEWTLWTLRFGRPARSACASGRGSRGPAAAHLYRRHRGGP